MIGVKETLYENHYYCSGDHEYGTRHKPVRWVDSWSCMCNDRCPECRTEIEAYVSIDTRDGNKVIHAPEVYRKSERLL